jgi:hypothetical protein
MSRDGAIMFRDLVGKLHVLNAEYDKDRRRGRFHLRHWSDEIAADCSRRHSGNLYDQYGARYPDLSKVV